MKQEKEAVCVVYGTDVEGNKLAFVPVRGAWEYANRYLNTCGVCPPGFAVLDREDFDRIEAEGHPLHWYLNTRSKSDPKHAYVKFHAKGLNNRRVAHLVAQIPQGRKVSYSNGNRLDLRRANLVIRKGHSKADCFGPSEQEATAATGTEAYKQTKPPFPLAIP